MEIKERRKIGGQRGKDLFVLFFPFWRILFLLAVKNRVNPSILIGYIVYYIIIKARSNSVLLGLSQVNSRFIDIIPRVQHDEDISASRVF